MSEPSSLDSLPERQLPDWKTVVWNVATEMDLEKSSIWSEVDCPNRFIAMAHLSCRGTALKKSVVDES